MHSVVRSMIHEFREQRRGNNVRAGNKSDNKVNGEQRIILKIFETHVERASISNVNPVKIWTGRRMMVSNKRLNNFVLFLGSELV